MAEAADAYSACADPVLGFRIMPRAERVSLLGVTPLAVTKDGLCALADLPFECAAARQSAGETERSD